MKASSSSSSAAAAGSSPIWWCITTCLMYGVGSGSLAFWNKYLVNNLGFGYTNTLLLMQMAFCVALFAATRAIGVMAFTHVLPPAPSRIAWWAVSPSWSHAASWALFLWRLTPVSLFSLVNAGCGMLSLAGLSLPMYSVLKRFTPLVVVGLEYALYRRIATSRVLVSLALCASGFVLAGLGDLVFDAGAYGLAISSCVSQALYLMSVDRVGRELGLASHELLYYNSLLSLVALAPFVAATGEMRQALFEFQGWIDTTFLTCLLIMLLLGISLNYCQFLCTQVNSPLTTCMVGVMKGIVTTAAGFFMFGGQPVTALNLIGVTLNTIGGALYAWAKFADKEDQVRARRSAAVAEAAATAAAEKQTAALEEGVEMTEDALVTTDTNEESGANGELARLLQPDDRPRGRTTTP